MIQLYSSNDTWWIGLSKYYREDWTWIQSDKEADLSLYSGYFTPSDDGGKCVVMTVADRVLQWVNIDCMAVEYEDRQLGAVCQCKGDCDPPTTTTTKPVPCQDQWIDAGDLGCIKFLR